MRAARVDSNQEAIVKALRAASCSVQSLAKVGEGCPDILVGAGGPSGFVAVFEIKDPSKPPADQEFTPKQKQWHREWLGPAYLVKTPQQALDIVALLRYRMNEGKRKPKDHLNVIAACARLDPSQFPERVGA